MKARPLEEIIDSIMNDDVEIKTKKYKNYMVSWQDKEGTDFCKLFRIEQTVNRPNNPDDEEIIEDYMRVNYGNSMRYSVNIDFMDETITIDEDYQIET